MSMDNPRYDSSDEFDDYDVYQDGQWSSMGLPTGQLALIIGVNAVVSLIISIAVVLIANRQVFPGEVVLSVPDENIVTTETSQANALPGDGANNTNQTVVPAGTPIQSVTYEVEPGDTLGLIAEKFSVSLFDLMIVNGLTNQDFIQVGQKLTIPLGGLPTVTPTFTPIPIPSPTPLPFDPPTPLPEGADLPLEPAVTVGPSPTSTPTIIPTIPITSEAPVLTGTTVSTEVIVVDTPTPLPTSTLPPFDEVSVVIMEINDQGDLLGETMVLFNQGAGVSLNEWQLEGSPLGIFVFPDFFLFSGGSIRIHTTAGQNSPSDLYLNQGESAWPSGATIILGDADGNQVTSFIIP